MKKILYLSLIALSIVMAYPLLWLVGASFKDNAEIFSTIWFVPDSFDIAPYINGWNTVGSYSMGHYFINTFLIIIPKTFFTVVSSTLTAYGFARYDFPFKKIFFAIMMGTMFMPQITTLLPSYFMWSKLSALDTYIPLILPSLFACEGLFIFMLIQFFKGIPIELDEAASLDGCDAIKKLCFIYAPCIRPAIISVAVFTFLWTMNDFMMPLMYISSVEKYPLTLALRMTMDNTGQGYEQNKIIAMSILGLLPSIAVFAVAQKKFTQGIVTGGIVG